MKIEIDLQQKWNVLKNAAMVDLDIILLLLYTEMHRLTHFNRLAETFLMKSLAINEIAHFILVVFPLLGQIEVNLSDKTRNYK